MSVEGDKLINSTPVNDDPTGTANDVIPSPYALQLIVTRKLDVNRDIKRDIWDWILITFVTLTGGQKNETRKE